MSLAVRVEPHLLRTARLALLPHLDASAEADLWFGSLVRSRNPLGIVLRVEVLDDLRSELAETPGLLDRAYRVVARIHRHDPPALQLEERLTWLGLGGGGGTEEAERLLQQAVFSMVEEDREGIARWSARAFERLPASIRALEAGRMLDIGSKARLGTPITKAEAEGAGDWLAWVAPAFPTLDANVRLLEGAVEMGLDDIDGANELRLADTKPPYVDVSWQVGSERRAERVTLTSGSSVIVETGTSTVRLQTALGRTWELAGRRRLATERVFGLRGRIVAMDDASTVIDDGIVWVEGQTIFAVQPATDPPPPSFEDVEVVEVGGTIYPGLIELHNHLLYDVLPLWQVRRRYTNRRQWARSPDYRAFVSEPSNVLRRTPEVSELIVRWVETRCLASGVTTSQGLKGAVQAPRLATVAVRIAEQSDDRELPSAQTRINSSSLLDGTELLGRLGKGDCFLLHLAEGTDAAATHEFESLRTRGGEWAISRNLAIIHGTALGRPELDTVAQHEGAVVWSPLHDLLLYGQTLDLRASRAAGLRIGLGSSWSVTGSRNLLGELKWARAASRAVGGPYSEADLVASATRIAADILGWGRLLGSIVVGKRADLIVVEGRNGDPYSTLIDATEAQLKLVMIDGVARAGLVDLMVRFGRGAETRDIAGSPRIFDFQAAAEVSKIARGMTIADAERRLREVLGNLPRLAAGLRADPDRGLEEDGIPDAGGAESEPISSGSAGDEETRSFDGPVPMTLEPLTIADDPEYSARIAGQPNLPRDIVEALDGGQRMA